MDKQKRRIATAAVAGAAVTVAGGVYFALAGADADQNLDVTAEPTLTVSSTPPSVTPPAAASPAAEPSTGAGDPPTAPPTSATATPAAAPSFPAPRAGAAGSVAIDALGAQLELVPVGVADDGQMAVPENPNVAGWYKFGPPPGSAEGATVIAAHVDDRRFGVGPFSRLGSLSSGDTVSLTVDGTEIAYVVERVQRTPKAALDSEGLFDRSGAHRVHLVTCGGAFNDSTRHYDDNIIATLIPAP